MWKLSEPNDMMPNIYYLGFKTGEALHYLSSLSSAENTNSLSVTIQVLKEGISNIPTLIYDFPSLYGKWWWNLVRNDPIHVWVETTLVLSIIYILVARSKDWKENEEHLSEKEEEELLREWKLHGRAPITPPSPISSENSTTSSTDNIASEIVVHKVHGPYMDISIGDHKAVVPNNNNVLKKKSKPPPGDSIITVLNFATFDYLGMSSNQPTVRQAADQALNKYGCGSCGPRGFYGTIDVHLQLERDFANFLGVDGAILYSDGASTCSSTVAAFAKRGDLLLCDEGIYEPLRTGVTLSRAHVKWFKHNDMADLRRVLLKIQALDQKVKRPINAQRRFLVVEGLYKTTGTIVPLKELVQLKHEFSYRLILDESNSFGTLGKTGRGVHELYNCKLMHDVEITTISLENAMGSIGGITVGTEEVVEHQRLSGSGYCFSASSPPFTAVAAMEALKLLKNSPNTTLQPLQDNVAYLHHKLTQLCHVQLEDVFLVTSAPESPIVLLQVADIPETKDLEELLFLQEVVQECLLRTGKSRTGLALAVVHSPPGIRINVSAAHTHEHLDAALRILTESVEVVMSSRFH